MNIIEKLGITPGPWEYDRSGTIYNEDAPNEMTEIGMAFCADITIPGCRSNTLADARLIAAAPEMIEALINAMSIFDAADYGDTDLTVPIKCVIEKATGKTWSEIKELI